MDFNFEEIDFTKLTLKPESDIKKQVLTYDKTTTETYRIKRILKIDPLTHTEVPENLRFEYENQWNPITGEVIGLDEVGPLCFNAITLYDYLFANRYKGLWNPASDGYEGYYGDLVGSGSKLEIKSRGFNPEKYLFRLPIIDCYLHPDHNYSIITMGPILTNDHIKKIDHVVLSHHKNKKFLTPLAKIKDYYDKAIEKEPNCDEFIEYKKKYSQLAEQELKENFNRMYVDKLVKIKY